MKKTLFKKTLLAVPAAALMLGSAEAQTTVGFNVTAYYYNSGTTPQTIGYGAGYQTTGFPVTAAAFGVPLADWYSTDPLTAQGAISQTITFGPLSAELTAQNAWMSGIGEINTGAFVPQAVSPGNDEVTWGYLDDGNATGGAPSATVSGLTAAFPHGYVVQSIAAEGNRVTFQGVEFSDGTTTSSNTYNAYYVANTHNSDTSGGTVGLSAPGPVFTGNSLQILPQPTTSGTRSTLAAFIITDIPVITQSPDGVTNNLSEPFSLAAGSVIGVPPLSYQWQLNGSNISGATLSVYSNSNPTAADSGSYTLVVSNALGATTSSVAQVNILLIPSISQDLPPAITNYSTMNATLEVAGGGPPPLTYTWLENGQTNSSATNAVLTLTNLQTSDGGSYQLIIRNNYGATTSGVSVLTVLPSAPPYEGFAYSAGGLSGQNGGVGWSGAWSNETTSGYAGEAAVVTSVQPWRGGLAELTSSGGALELAAVGGADYDDIRSLLTTVGGPGSGTVYISVAMQVTNTTWGGIELVQDSVTTLFLGECWEGSDWGWGTRAGPDVKSTIAPSAYSLLVYRFDYTPTDTLVSLYVNPSSLASEPSSPTISGSEAKQVTFDQLRIVSHGFIGSGAGPDGLLDEVRIGGSWASVTPHTLRNDQPFSASIIPGGVILDTKPSGTSHDGEGRNLTWRATSPDMNSVSRSGVEQFSSGNGGQIVIPADPDFTSATGTISFWMQYSIPLAGFPGTGAEAAMLVDHRTTNGAIICLSTGGGIEFQAYRGINSFSGGGYLVDGAWHHVAVTYDTSATGSVSIYVDGALDTSHPNTNSWTWPLSQEIEIGKSHDPYWYVYDGQLDDFRIYNTVLSPSEIATIGAMTTSDQLAEPNALVVRYNFDTAGTGTSISWPFGILQSSPTLGPDQVWTSLTNAVSPMPIISTAPAVFYRLFATP